MAFVGICPFEKFLLFPSVNADGASILFREAVMVCLLLCGGFVPSSDYVET